MENITTLMTATLDALTRDYYLWVAILGLMLAFAIYVYLFPNSIDFFVGSATEDRGKDNDRITVTESKDHSKEGSQ